MKLIDLTNKVFGDLTVIRRSEKSKPQKIIWECRCKCGRIVFVQAGNLTSGNSTCCGKGVCHSRTIEYGEASFNSLYEAYQRNSLNKGFDFLLAPDDFKEITKQDCFYCGKKPEQIYKKGNANGGYIYNGVDRIDSSIGYILENVVACCWFCNYAKNTSSQNDFINWIREAYNNLKLKGFYNE